MPRSVAAVFASCTLTPADAEWSSRVRLDNSGYTDSDHVSVLTPSVSGSVEDATRGVRVGGSYLVDIVSAASVDIVSTASARWNEVRHAGTLDARYKPGSYGISANGYASREPDYLSLGGGGSLIADFDNHAHTFTLGYGYSQDVAGRSGTPFNVFSYVINKHAFSPSLTLTLDRATVLTLLFDAVIERGDTSKPYRHIPMFAPGTNVPVGASVDYVNSVRLSQRPLEHVPAARNRFSWAARLLHRWDAVTLRLNQRLYADSWGMLASTTDLRLPVDLSTKWRAYPHARVHVQKGVSFWQRAYTIDDNGAFPTFFAGDRELGPLRTFTFGGGAQWDLGRFIVNGQVDGLLTQFADTIYITRRYGILATIGIEALFE